MSSIQVYILYLLRWLDPATVFEEEELRIIEEEIEERIPPQYYVKYEEFWKVYMFRKEEFEKNTEIESSKYPTIKSIEMHHLLPNYIIFDIILSSKISFGDLMGKISIFKEECDKKIEEIIEHVNSKLEEGGKHEKRIVDYCSYPLIICEGKSARNVPLSDFSSIGFDIFEISWPWKLHRLLLPWQWHMVRISSLRTIVYTKGMNNKLKFDIINAIYQYGLYEMTERNENTIDRRLLIQFRDRMMDTLVRTRYELYLCSLTLILVLLTTILAVLDFLPYLSHLFTLIKI